MVINEFNLGMVFGVIIGGFFCTLIGGWGFFLFYSIMMLVFAIFDLHVKQQ